MPMNVTATQSIFYFSKFPTLKCHPQLSWQADVLPLDCVTFFYSSAMTNRILTDEGAGGMGERKERGREH